MTKVPTMSLPKKLWCSACESFKATFLFNPWQQPRSENVRRCMQCEKQANDETRRKGRARSVAPSWRNHDDLFAAR